MKNGSKIVEEISVADAHPNGKNPFKRKDYIKKFETLTNGIIESSESERFLNDVQNLRNLSKSELNKLNIQLKEDLRQNKISNKGIFFILLYASKRAISNAARAAGFEGKVSFIDLHNASIELIFLFIKRSLE